MKLLLLIGMIAVYASALAAEPSPASPSVNPHTDKGNCDVCHVASEEDLTSWFTFASTKKKMKKGHSALCQECHGLEFGHGVGLVPKVNEEGLPVDPEGKIACAITCHNMHIKSDDYKQSKYHLRFSGTKLCLSCHTK